MKLQHFPHKILFPVAIVLSILLLPPSVHLMASVPDQQTTCGELTTLLLEKEQQFTREVRSLKRDIAALHHKLDKPDIKDIFGGIGYIIGLFGIAAFVAARRNNSSTQE